MDYVQSVERSDRPKESLSISTTSTEGTFEVSYVLTATQDWSDGSKITILRNDSLTISAIPRLSELWEEVLSLLADLENGDKPVSETDDDPKNDILLDHLLEKSKQRKWTS